MLHAPPSGQVHFGLCVEAVTSYILMLKASDKDILKEPESAADKAKSGMGMREILKKLDKDSKVRETVAAVASSATSRATKPGTAPRRAKDVRAFLAVDLPEATVGQDVQYTLCRTAPPRSPL